MPKHVGRFAPSPTGPLHAGSLVAALGSYLCARKQHGEWLVRIEDLDPPREQKGAADSILYCLETHGLEWDGEVVYQSQQHHRYQSIVDELLRDNLAYACECSRKQINAVAEQGNFGAIYPGTCRNKSLKEGAVRLHTHDQPVGFDDAAVGYYAQKLESELGDFVIQRKDGLFAYQLAVVLDDAETGITDVVRGIDLLDNTPRQIHLQQILQLQTPQYLHLPLVLNKQGQKLSKQNMAPELNNGTPGENLLDALAFLGFDTEDLDSTSVADILQWALLEADWGDTSINFYAD